MKLQGEFSVSNLSYYACTSPGGWWCGGVSLVLFSLSTKLTTRNVNPLSSETPRGRPWCQPGTSLWGVCLHRGANRVTEANEEEKEKPREAWRIISASITVCDCVPRSGTKGLLGWFFFFVQSRGLCSAPLGSRLLFQDATCWEMYSALSSDGPPLPKSIKQTHFWPLSNCIVFTYFHIFFLRRSSCLCLILALMSTWSIWSVCPLAWPFLVLHNFTLWVALQQQHRAPLFFSSPCRGQEHCARFADDFEEFSPKIKI